MDPVLSLNSHGHLNPGKKISVAKKFRRLPKNTKFREFQNQIQSNLIFCSGISKSNLNKLIFLVKKYLKIVKIQTNFIRMKFFERNVFISDPTEKHEISEISMKFRRNCFPSVQHQTGIGPDFVGIVGAANVGSRAHLFFLIYALTVGAHTLKRD